MRRTLALWQLSQLRSRRARLLAQPAKPRVLKPNWVEHRSASFFPIAMSFKVKQVTLGKKAWSAKASFTNRSTKPDWSWITEHAFKR